jgi:hypothetical protein
VRRTRFREGGGGPSRGLAATAAAVGVALALSACGGSGALSHSQLVSKAGADCRRATQAAAKLGAPGTSFSSLNTYARGLAPIVTNLIGDLNALKPAAADRSAVQSYVGALRGGDQGLQLLATASSPAEVTQARSILASQSLSGASSVAPACGASP